MFAPVLLISAALCILFHFFRQPCLTLLITSFLEEIISFLSGKKLLEGVKLGYRFSKGRACMKIFIDSANREEIEEVSRMGLLDGVTTNPSLVAKERAKERVELGTLLRDICSLVDGPISAEVTALQAEEMFVQGQKLASIHKNIVVKVPLIEEGLKATQMLSAKEIRTNVTLCFNGVQALMAAKAGATYVSPFIGRLDDISYDGSSLIEEIRTVYNNYGIQTKILAASVRSPKHVLEVALLGADVATIPYKTIKSLLRHPLTDIGLKKFLKDWESAK